MADKYYVYGCAELLENLRELIDEAAKFEEEGKSAQEWLNHEGFEHAEKFKRHLSWGVAINIIILRHTKQLLRIREDSISDWPF